MRRLTFTHVFLALLPLLAAIGSPRSVTAQPGNPPPHVPDEVIIKFKSNASEVEKDQIRAGLGGSKVRGLGRIRAELRKLGALSVDDAIAQYKNHPKVEYIEPNYILNVVETPNDPQFSQLYGMQNTGQTGGTPGADISATNAWDVFTGSSQVLIGVIDTGVDYTHPDLAANVWINPGEIPGNGIDDDGNGYIDDVRGWDFANNDNDPMDDHGHGSHVSGTIGAVGNNSTGVVGVCWNVKILPIKFLTGSGSGTTANAVLAVEYATLMGARLTSNSWGGGGFSQALFDAIQDANLNGILFVAAAGNSSANTDVSAHYPSSYNLPNIISVAATDHNDQLASFSNYGATTVDLAAPGVNILSTFPGNSYGSISGTSMATPHVSGALGLVVGRFPAIGHLDAKNLILNFADPLPQLSGVVLTGARLNAFLPIADPDSIAPSPITDLVAVEAGSNWLVVNWTATGDDEGVGTASRYVVKYSAAPIDAGNFDAAMTAPDPPDPGPAGASESMRINGLDFNTTYYVAVKALDEFGNTSDVSNVASGTTLGIPDIAATPLSLSETLLSGATAIQQLTLSNVGFGTLDFTVPTPVLITSPQLVAEYVELAKDVPDPRPGILGNGGPDGFGYRWVDSDEPGGPVFDWTDISGTGTLAMSSGIDVNNGPYPIGFTFPFYGVEYNTFRICSNGWISFNSTSTAYSNQPLPNAGAPTAMVAPFWDDINLTTSGDVHYESDGSRLVVQWTNAAHYGSGGNYTFQAILYNDGTIEYQYLTMGSPTNSATIGMQNAARDDGLQVVFNDAYMHDGLKVRIAAVPQWVEVAPSEGTIYAPNSTNLDVSFTSTGLLGGVYDATIQILSNDPDESPFEVPVQLTVIGAPDVAVAPTSIDYGQVFLGASPVEVLSVQNPGTDVLHVSSISVDNAVYTLNQTAFDVPPRSGMDVEVTFSPVAVGMYPATITILSDDPDEPSVQVPLTGEGVPPPAFSVSPTSLASSLFTGESESQQLLLSNTGGADLEWSTSVQFVSASQLFTLTAPDATSTEADGGTIGPDNRTTPIQVELADLTGVDILWDRSNGQTSTTSWTTLIADLESRGATVTVSTSPITPALLAGYDVLWSVDTGSSASFDADELAALTAWVNAGGGILLEGDNTSSVGMYNDLLAALGAGIVYSLNDNATGTTTNIHPHETTQGVTGIYITAAVASIGSVVAPAGPLVDDINGVTNTAYSKVGLGRIITAADEIFQNSRMSQASNQLFGNQVFDWLATNAFLTLNPTSGTVPPGGSQPVNVNFEATGLFGGLYQADILIATNDPLAPEVTVPAALQVTGAPDVVVDPTALDFGPVFVGYPDLLEFEIRNAGTDQLTISSITSDNPAFSIFLGGGTFPIQLAPLATTIVQARFSPPAVGPFSGMLTVNSNDPDTPAVPVSVMGSGLLPPVASVNPTVLHSDLFTGETETQQVTLSNTGASDLDWTAQIQFVPTVQPWTLTPPDLTGVEADGGVIGPDTRTTPIQADLADLTGIDILWDRSNGQTSTTSWTTMIADLESRGATVTVSTDPITPALLAGYDVLWSVDTGSSASFDADELAALTAWVNAGGGILLEGDNTSSVGMYNDLLAALGAGIVYSLDDNASGVATTIYPHPTTENVTGIYLTAAVASIGSTTAPAGPLVDDINGRTNTAFSIVGAGRIITAADEIFQNSRMSQADNQLFGNQVFDWLASPAFLSVDPNAGILPPGGSVVLDVQFDAGGLFGGNYASNVRVLSNDPANGAIDVAATLTVTGVPKIAFGAASVDFGDVFVGYPSMMTLTVTNDGTDLLSVSSVVAGLPDYSVDMTAFDLNPLESRDLMVTFDPQALGDRSSMLTFTSNDAASPHMVAVTGAGRVAPVAGVDPDSLHADLLTGEMETQQVTLTNSGGSDLEWSTRLTFESPTQAFSLTPPDVPVAEEDGGTIGPNSRTTPIQAELADLTGVQIMFDRSHSQGTRTSWTTIIADWESRGATVTDNTDPFTPALLAGYNVLWSVDLSGSWDPGELAAVSDWVNAGGAVMLEGDNVSSVGLYNELLTALGAGIEFSTTSGASGTTSNIYPHPTTENVTGVYFTANVASIPTIVAPAVPLVDDVNGVGAAAASVVGAGRIFATSDEIFQNSRMSQADNQLFGNQVMDWLATAAFLSVNPESGVVPPGGSTLLDVTYDATGMFGGDYKGAVHVMSNDPANGDLRVAATLHVTPVPRFAFDPESLHFGDVFIGYPAQLVLTVRNAGTDLLSVTSMTPGLADYSVDVPSFDLNPFESRDLTVTFDPQASGDRSALLTFTSNDPDSPHDVPVTGVGLVPPVISASPDTIEAAALPGGMKIKTLTVCNTGGSDLNWFAQVQSVAASAAFTLMPPDASSVESDGGAVGSDFRTTPIQATLADLTGVDIMYDRAHGQSSRNSWTTIIADLESRGATVTDNSAPLTPELLANYDVYWSTDMSTSSPWTSGELTALADWLSAGGGILLEGDNTGSVAMYNELLTHLVAGITYSLDDNASGTTSNIYPHPTTQDVTGIYITAAVASIGSIAAPAAPLVDDVNGLTNTAYSELGLGRIVAAADELFQNSRMGTADNQLFGNQVFDWLSAISFLSVAPESGVIPAGECADLNVTLDATDLAEGDYAGRIALLSNDPATPELGVPVLFHVGSIDVADIDVDPDVVNLGGGGAWITAYVELPMGYDPADIVLATVRCNGVPAAAQASTIGDFNSNGIPDRQFKFPRADVAATLAEDDSAEVTVLGEIEDTIFFVGTTYIRVIHPQLIHPNGGEVLAAGNTVDVIWTNPPGFENALASLAYSDDDGETWMPVVDGISGQSYSWQVPVEQTGTGRIRVYIFESGQRVLGFDTSDQPFTIGAAVTGVDDDLPTEYALRFAVANPVTRGRAAVELALPEAAPVRLGVYDVRGALVKELVSSPRMEAGRHRIEWDRTNRAGSFTSAGVYFIRATAGGRTFTTRFAVLQ